MKIFEIEQNSVDNIVNNIHNISVNDPDGWYVSGGCYEFAEALKKAFGSQAKIISADSADGDQIHSFVKYKNKFYDINGEHNTPEDVIDDGDYYYTPPLSFSIGNGYADEGNVSKLVHELKL